MSAGVMNQQGIMKLNLRSMTNATRRSTKLERKHDNVENRDIAPLQNTTRDVVIVANRLIKCMMNVLHDTVSVQSSTKYATCCRQKKFTRLKTKIC